MTTRIVCQQLAPRIGDLPANRELCRQAVRDAVAAGGQVVLLPELATSGYVFASAAEAAALAITPDHPVFDDWAAEAAAGPAVVAAGFCEAGADGRVHNSAALVGPDGVLAVYRKIHLWDREKLVFSAGEAAPPVVDTPFGRIGLLICYDLEFPEMTRTVALAGADLLAVPTNWPLVPRPDGERPPEVLIGMAAARVNHLAIACCDRTGVERGQEWTAGSTIIDSEGWPAAETAGAGGPGTLVADLDLARSRDKSWTELADVFADRRPHLYRAVSAPG